MKILTLFFACVASRNFARVNAMHNGDGAGSSKDVTGIHNRGVGIVAWHAHVHNHFPLDRPSLNHLTITKVVNGKMKFWHHLKADLVPDSDIAKCGGPEGYAIVDIHNSVRLCACMQPESIFNPEFANEDNLCPHPVFFAKILAKGGRELIADLAPSRERSSLESLGLLHYGEENIASAGARPVGHIRYIKSDPHDRIDVEGTLYELPEPEEP